MKTILDKYLIDLNFLFSGWMQVNTGLLGEAGQILTNGSEPAQPRSASNVMGQQGHHPQHIVMSPATSQTGNDPGHSSGASVAKPSKKNSTGRNNVYRAKELAEIKNGLLPFEKAENIRDSREGLRTVSSLSTESSTNSVCSEGFSSMQDASQKLNILGYDEVCKEFYFVITKSRKGVVV